MNITELSLSINALSTAINATEVSIDTKEMIARRDVLIRKLIDVTADQQNDENVFETESDVHNPNLSQSEGTLHLVTPLINYLEDRVLYRFNRIVQPLMHSSAEDLSQHLECHILKMMEMCPYLYIARNTILNKETTQIKLKISCKFFIDIFLCIKYQEYKGDGLFYGAVKENVFSIEKV